jgi:enoyl-[acyl-carrier protein] reductase II
MPPAMNRLTVILGSRYPILQGAMGLISLREMAAAVTRSGAFGIIAASRLEGSRIREEIRKARSLTDKPFGVNIPIYRPNALEAVKIAIEEGVKTLITSAGDPKTVIRQVREGGVKILQVIATVDMAIKAEDARGWMA